MKEYIERAAVHELVKRIPKYEMFNYDRTTALLGIDPDDVDFGVDKIPAADVVEVRHGRWESNGPDDIVVYCSQCMMPQDAPSNYCPSCGCRMDAKEPAHD